MNHDLLTTIPDPQTMGFDDLLAWLDDRIKTIKTALVSENPVASFAPIQLSDEFSHPLGPEASDIWRRFFLSTLLADWVSFDRPADRADFSRLKYIMTSTYKYVRLWGCRLKDGTFAPLGYTLWHPLPRFVFEGVLNNPLDVDDRAVFLPSRRENEKTARCGYIFNISLAKGLHHTPCAKELCQAFHNDLSMIAHIPLVAAVVSADGERFFSREGFSPQGSITVDGETETLYVRPQTPA